LPTFVDRSVVNTSINISSDVKKRSITNGSSSRKFASVDDSREQEKRSVVTKSNTEHVANENSSDLSIALDSITRNARQALDYTRKKMMDQDANADTKTTKNVSESDSTFTQNDLSKDLSNDVASVRAAIDGLFQDNIFEKASTTPEMIAFNNAIPKIFCVTIDVKKNMGAVDCFFAKIKFVLKKSDVKSGKIKAFRLFRSTTVNPTFERGAPPVISIHGLERISALNSRTRCKGIDQLSSVIRRFSESNILSSVSVLSPIDVETNRRMSTELSHSSGSINSAANKSNDTSFSNVSSFLDSDKFSSLDASVTQNLNVIRNLRRTDTSMSSINTSKKTVFHTTKPNSLRTFDNDSSARFVIVNDGDNKQEFRELSILPLDGQNFTESGDFVFYEFMDQTVEFGKGFKYFLTSVDNDMVESVRSPIVNVTIEGIRIPERPKSATTFRVSNGVSINVVVDDQMVEKFEIFRKEENSSNDESVISRNVSDFNGFNVGESLSSYSKNGFVKIGESLNGLAGQGGTFYDVTARPGRTYEYRIYSVDVFGNKSESPLTKKFFVNDPMKPNELLKPTMTVEVDSNTKKARLTFKCSDERVKTLFLGRRDLTLCQNAFTVPSQTNALKFGNSAFGESNYYYEDIVLRGENKDVSWTGMFENSLKAMTFIDLTSKLDHVYQYRLHGVDSFGNVTSFEMSKTILISNRPTLDTPVNLTAQTILGSNFSLNSVRLTWNDANQDFSSEDNVGSQNALADTSVRTLYQLERRKLGQERWDKFPLMSGNFFVDQVVQFGTVDVAPSFRPSFVQENNTYAYRIKSVQTGSFISNFSDEVNVFAGLPAVEPTNFVIKFSDIRVRPFFVVLNWNTPNNSGVIDQWEIQRVAVNNFAANGLSAYGELDFSNLDFEDFRIVFRESSRFTSEQLDSSRNMSSSLFVGQHYMQDTDVSFGNTFVYRIRAVGVSGDSSNWVYRGIKLTEEISQNVISFLIGDASRNELSTSFTQIVVKTGDEDKTSSFSLQPAYSKPNTTRKISKSSNVSLRPEQVSTFDSRNTTSVAAATRNDILNGNESGWSR